MKGSVSLLNEEKEMEIESQKIDHSDLPPLTDPIHDKIDKIIEHLEKLNRNIANLLSETRRH